MASSCVLSLFPVSPDSYDEYARMYVGASYVAEIAFHLRAIRQALVKEK